MKRQLTTGLLSGVMVLAGAATIGAQFRAYRADVPRVGACFYEDTNYDGDYFCANVGTSSRQVPRDANDEISSIRLFGNVEVQLYRDNNYGGRSTRIDTSIRSLHDISGFNDEISSYRITARRYSSGGNWSGGGAFGGGASYGRWGNSSRDEPERLSLREAQAIVRRAYLRVLGRMPDPASAGWVSQVMAGEMSEQELIRELRKSPEARGR